MKLRKILVVDDNPDVLKVLQADLKPEYDVFIATNGVDALSIMETEDDIVLVISDHKMSGMTGVELMEELARKYPDTVRMLVTGYAEDALLMNAINVGHIYGIISKPWEVTELRTTVRNAIRHYEKIQMLREPHVRSLLHSGILSAEQLESVIQTNEDSTKSLVKILVDRGIITPNELEKSMKFRDDSEDCAEALVERGLVFESDLEMAREQQKRERKSLTDTLVEMGYADEDTILACYSVHLGIPCIPLPQFPQRASVARLMPSRLGYEHNIVPVDAAGKAIVIAVSEPLSEEMKASIEAEIGKRVTSILARRKDIQEALRTYYPDGVPEDREYQRLGEELEGAVANAQRS